jgi:hypothetical protein
MAHVIKDLATGTVVIIVGICAFIALSIVLFVLGIALHIIGAIASVVFFVALVFLSIWLVGFAYRKIKETNRK